MEAEIIRHTPRHFHFTLARRFEIERDCLDCPEDLPEAVARCPDCGCVMVYRGIGLLRNGRQVHYFECIHSPGEVHGISIVITR